MWALHEKPNQLALGAALKAMERLQASSDSEHCLLDVLFSRLPAGQKDPLQVATTEPTGWQQDVVHEVPL